MNENKSLDVISLRAAIQARRIEWQQHVQVRLVERGISRLEVLEVLLHGERIEDYPNDYPWPSALFFGTCGHRPLHVVAALSPKNETVAIITAYEPDDIRFEADFRTRKRK